MKIGGGIMFAASRPISLFFESKHRSFSSLSSSSFSCSSPSSIPDHIGFVKEIAGTDPPKHLSLLLRLLKARGESIVSPGSKQGLIPLIIPLAKNCSDNVIALLRWPTSPAGMEMPVVEVHKHGVWLLSKTVDQFINRILVEEDAKKSLKRNEELFHVAASGGENLYEKGDFLKSKISDVDVYLSKKVGLFPDVLERIGIRHFEKGDHVSALVTGEYYTRKEHFPGFARPFVFNAEVLLKVGRKLEAKDAARGALKSPWWTLGCKYQEVAQIAEWEDEQIEYFKEKMTKKGRQEELNKGKDPAQIALDEAAFLLDLASVEGTWDESLERIAACYKEARLLGVARFIEFRD